MGHPDGAHTHGSGGSGIGTAVLVVLGAALAMNLAGPVAAAAGELLHIVMVAAGVILGLGVAVLAAVITWRLRHRRPRTPQDALAANYRGVVPPPGAGASGAVTAAQRPALEQPVVHLHLHGVSAEDIAAILARRDRPRPDVNRPGPPHVP
jgi:hypothetical protein